MQINSKKTKTPFPGALSGEAARQGRSLWQRQLVHRLRRVCSLSDFAVSADIWTGSYIVWIFASAFFLMGCSQRKNETTSHNKLISAASPYLREHADNPVNWFEWGPEALEKAREEGKPIIISIGYASCHWCHVMEKESFMDTTVARLMNEHFISIKIDREERPDIDQIYLNAAQLISGNAGWPLNAFALPDGRPFYAGTYYPKEQWISMLKQISEAYRQKHDMIVDQASQLTQGIKSYELITTPADTANHFTRDYYKTLFRNWLPHLDMASGGFLPAPKFPMPIAWEFLLQYHHLTDDTRALNAVVTTLDAMARGGIYDQLGGGFSRYTVDVGWKIPHFEKMLYDNGQLVSLYAHAYQQTEKPLYAEIVHQTLAFIKRDLTSPEGAFYSSLNADSEGIEGKFYVWTSGEVDRLAGPDARLFKDYYQIADSGNWENGLNILLRSDSDEQFARANNFSVDAWRHKLTALKNVFFTAREKRIRPTTDDKVITGWNALMLKGYVDSYSAFGTADYLNTAIANAKFLEENLIEEDGRVFRSLLSGKKVHLPGFLDDYALLARAFISLYQTTFDIHWLNQAKRITDYAIAHFRDDATGLFYYTSDLSEELIARKTELADNVIPSSNSVLADVLFQLGDYYSEEPYVLMAESMLRHMDQPVNNSGRYYANWSRLIGWKAFVPYEVAIMGEEAIQMSRALQKHYLPQVIFMGGDAENLPLLENKLLNGQTVIYVCRNKVCKFPVRRVEDALKQLRAR